MASPLFFEMNVLHARASELIAQVTSAEAGFVTSSAAAGITIGPSLQTDVETFFHQAIDSARRQRAKSLELRAVLSLSRLWHKQGKGDEAYRLLKEVYETFTEGFDTPDLRDAKALLNELA